MGMNYRGESISPPFPVGRGAQRIALERFRQTQQEGWTSEHDDQHTDMSLNFAAQAYCQAAMEPGLWPCEEAPCPPIWPWEAHWFKPSEDPVHNLVRAGALIAAEIDRIERSRAFREQGDTK